MANTKKFVHVQTSLDAEVAKKLRIHCFKLGVSVKSYLAKLIQAEIELYEDCSEEDFDVIRSQLNKEMRK